MRPETLRRLGLPAGPVPEAEVVDVDPADDREAVAYARALTAGKLVRRPGPKGSGVMMISDRLRLDGDRQVLHRKIEFVDGRILRERLVFDGKRFVPFGIDRETAAEDPEG